MMKKILYTAIYFCSLLSCDLIEDPIPPDLGNSITLAGDVEFVIEPELSLNDTNALKLFIANNNWDTIVNQTEQNKRYVILEEFTGHECRECPRGAREITRLKADFEEQLIPIAIHTGSFAKPRTSGTKFLTNFVVPGDPGKSLEQRFKLIGYPTGIVNRKNSQVVSSSRWQADVQSYASDTDPVASIKITNYYSSAINVVRSEIEVDWNTTLTDSINLQVELTEDSIVDWQLDGNTEIPDYTHKHVLRKVVNSTYGVPLKQAIQGTTQKIQYIYSVNPEWKAEHVEVVAFIFENTPNSLEVLQANAAHIH